MKKITKQQKAIADAHLAAFSSGAFDNPPTDGSLEQIKKELLAGKTIQWIYEKIAIDHTTIASQLMASPKLLGHHSQSYKAGIYKGFKTVLNNLNIK